MGSTMLGGRVARQARALTVHQPTYLSVTFEPHQANASNWIQLPATSGAISSAIVTRILGAREALGVSPLSDAGLTR
jgi:hypothetical protein